MALMVSQQLTTSKNELEVPHANLIKDFELLQNANKLIKGIHQT